jgi:trigger factor
LDISLDKSSATEASIKIRLSEADYQPNVDKKIKEYSRKATLKGFRPGKVPSSLIRKMYGKSIMVEELNQMLTQSITEYIKDNKLKIIGEPLPNKEKSENIDWENQKDFEFEYEIGMIGDFEYSLDKELTRYEISVDENAIKDTVENLRIQYGETINPESSEEGDYLYGELKQLDGDISRETVIALHEIKEGERENFTGVKPDDTIEFDIRKTFGEDRVIGLLSGKSTDEAKDISGQFTFKVSKIDRRVPAEMNQQFFDRLFGQDKVKTEDELKEKIAENLKQGYDQESEQLLTHHIRNKLVDEITMELPKDFLKRWLKANDTKIDDERLDQQFDAYTQELKWSILLNRIAEDLQIKVEQEDILDRARAVVANYLASSGMPSNFIEENMDKFVDNYLKGGDGKNLMELHEQVKGEKIINAIKEQLKIDRKSVTLDEFREIVSN